MRLVLTGGSGLLAINWAYLVRDHEYVCVFTHKHNVVMRKVASRHVDLLDVNAITQSLAEYNTELVVHTAGMTNVDECEKNPDAAYTANVTLAKNVALAARKLDLKLVHISTDHLFDGSKALVAEDEPPSPMNIYGKTKLQAENEVLDIQPDALIIRTSFYGWGHQYRMSISDWIINTLKKGESISAFCDVFFTPLLIDLLVSAVHELIIRRVSGIIHLGGDQRISKYDFALSVADIFNLDKQLIKRASIKTAELFAPRPHDMSLSNQKAVRLLGRHMGNVEVGLRNLYEQLQQGRPREFSRALS